MFAKYRHNYALLRRAADHLGKLYAAMPYDDLCGGVADESGGEIEFEGQVVNYAAYSYNVESNGDVSFCVDVRSRLPTFLGIKPSYQFVKRRDGSVRHADGPNKRLQGDGGEPCIPPDRRRA